MDEMKIWSGLVFRKYTGELVGYCNFGQVNDDLERLNESLNSESVTGAPKLANQVLVFMVWHIFKPSVSFHVAMYPSISLSGERPLIFDVVEALQLQGFPVVSLTCNGNSPNCRFYRICGLSTEHPVYKTPNPFANDREVYFFLQSTTPAQDSKELFFQFLFTRQDSDTVGMLTNTCMSIPQVYCADIANPLMAELISLGRSFYLRMTLTYLISGPVGFSDSKMHTATGPGITSILAAIRDSNHAHFLTSFRSDKVNALCHKVNRLWH